MSTTLADDRPTARKQHRCDDCGRTIEPGEKYRRWSGVGDLGVYTWKSCAHCDRATAAIWATDWARYMVDEGIDLGEVLTEYQIEPLASQWRQQWQGVAVEDIDTTVIAEGLGDE